MVLMVLILGGIDMDALCLQNILLEQKCVAFEFRLRSTFYLWRCIAEVFTSESSSVLTFSFLTH